MRNTECQSIDQNKYQELPIEILQAGAHRACMGKRNFCPCSLCSLPFSIRNLCDLFWSTRRQTEIFDDVLRLIRQIYPENVYFIASPAHFLKA